MKFIDKNAFDRLCLLSGIIALFAYLHLWPCAYLSTHLPQRMFFRMEVLSRMADGTGDLGDVFQDVIGFRCLCERRDAYPILNDALGKIGIQTSEMPFASTHPPTAFLFAAPIAYLPLLRAAQVWFFLCVLLIFLSLLCYGIRWMPAVGFSLWAGVLWEPFNGSFHQLTPIWLAGVAMAYRYRFHRTLWSGIGIGIASLTKLLPIGIAAYFLFARKYRAAIGIVIAWTCAVAVVLCLSPAAFSQYVSMARQGNTWGQFTRVDNIFPFAQAYFRFGVGGLALVAGYIGLLIWRNRVPLFRPMVSPDFSFFLYSFLAVMFLPLCWNYALMPLFPVLGYFMLRGRIIHRLIATIVIAGLVILPPSSRPGTTTLLLLLTSSMFFLEPPVEHQITRDSDQLSPLNSGEE